MNYVNHYVFWIIFKKLDVNCSRLYDQFVKENYKVGWVNLIVCNQELHSFSWIRLRHLRVLSFVEKCCKCNQNYKNKSYHYNNYCNVARFFFFIFFLGQFFLFIRILVWYLLIPKVHLYFFISCIHLKIVLIYIICLKITTYLHSIIAEFK